MGSEPNRYCNQKCDELEFSLNGPSPGHAQQHMCLNLVLMNINNNVDVNLRLLGFRRVS